MTITTPGSAEELRAFLNDPESFNAVYQDPTKLQNFLKDYATEAERRDQTIKDQIAEQAQAVIAEMTKNSRPTKTLPQAALSEFKGAAHNADAPGAAADGKFKNLAEFAQATWHKVGNLRNRAELGRKLDELQEIQNSYSSVIPDAGGALVPEEFRSNLLQIAMENAVVRPRATVIPMGSGRLSMPAVDETTRSGSVFGGVVAYWEEEGATHTESQASFGKVTLEPKKLTIYSEAPNELVADAPAFGSFLNQVLPKACSFYEDDAFINGAGVGTPLGALNSANTGLLALSRTTSSKVKVQDIFNIYTRMLPGSLGTAVWLISPDVLPQLLQLVMPTGDAITTYVAPPLWLTGQSVANSAPMQLLGRPVFVSEKAPKLGSQGDISFIDWTHYLIGDRQTMTMDSSAHYKFANDKTAYKIVERVDGQPWVKSPITPKNGSTNTLSPYVTIQA